jgi:actin-related protein 8
MQLNGGKLLWLRKPPLTKGMLSSLFCTRPLRHERRGSQVIVIHPGSRYIRLGRASEVNPIQVPCVVARKWKLPIQKTGRVNLVSRPKKKGEENIANDQETGQAPEKDPVRI